LLLNIVAVNLLSTRTILPSGVALHFTSCSKFFVPFRTPEKVEMKYLLPTRQKHVFFFVGGSLKRKRVLKKVRKRFLSKQRKEF